MGRGRHRGRWRYYTVVSVHEPRTKAVHCWCTRTWRGHAQAARGHVQQDLGGVQAARAQRQPRAVHRTQQCCQLRPHITTRSSLSTQCACTRPVHSYMFETSPAVTTALLLILLQSFSLPNSTRQLHFPTHVLQPHNPHRRHPSDSFIHATPRPRSTCARVPPHPPPQE